MFFYNFNSDHVTVTDSTAPTITLVL